MCGDVIEHIQKPMKFIDAVYNLLIENGVVIIKTPNYGSIGRKLVSSKRWYYSDPPFHLQLFTLKNLCQKLKFHQFNILRTQTSMSSVNIKRAFTRKRSIIRLRPLDNEIQEDGSIKESKITWKQKIVYFVFDSINLLTKPFKIGGSMIIYAKKRT